MDLSDFNGEACSQRVECLGEGRSACVYAEGDRAVKYLMAVPYHDASALLRREAHYLSQLQSATLHVPQLHSVSEQGGSIKSLDRARGYVGSITMERIQGAAFLNHRDVHSWSPQDQQQAFQDVGSFMASIHKETPAAYSGEYSVLWNMLEEAQMYDPDRLRKSGFYNQLSQKLMSLEQGVDPVFCHGDLSFDNIAFNAGERKPEALIDFAYSGYGMPETDFRHFGALNKFLFEPIKGAYEAGSGRQLDEERLHMVDLVSTLRLLHTCRNMPAYPTQEREVQAMDGRVKRLSEGVFGIAYGGVNSDYGLHNY
ncbi:MAG: aminoglycoside phosphotransferase family protein [Alphaproteobacteria bacterium]|nr:aminoglycoside phosphotransferase family protein [Alphaproteobacteria bacterium]